MYTQWGTFGRVTVGNFSCWSGEPCWQSNISSISCIPVGVYPVVPVMHYGGDGPGGNRDYPAWGLEQVQGRANIHIHVGNFPARGDSQGCILLGGLPQWFVDRHTIGVPNSRATFERFMATMGDTERCLISIRNTQQGIL